MTKTDSLGVIGEMDPSFVGNGVLVLFAHLAFSGLFHDGEGTGTLITFCILLLLRNRSFFI